MKIKSVITDSVEIRKLLKYFNLSAWRAPPAIKKTDIAA
jgi:hypothetical protein